ncbi:aminoglycoside adenylyltransferase domain-containing protein [Clostridium sp. Marseille-Q7071]
MKNKIPDMIVKLLDDYYSSINSAFRDKIFGVYVYNSLALGKFDANKSDIDFITILKRPLSKQELESLSSIHKKLNIESPYGRKMEGMYIQLNDLGKSNSQITPYPYFADGKLTASGYYDINYVTWWTLKHYGVGINSPKAYDLNFEVEWNNVLDTMDYNLNIYWKDKLNKSIVFLFDNCIEFSILTLCRILFTLENKKITSKVEGAKFSIEFLPSNWRLIIEEAIRIRENTSKNSLYTSKVKRAKEAKKFIYYIINYCNKNYKLKS